MPKVETGRQPIPPARGVSIELEKLRAHEAEDASWIHRVHHDPSSLKEKTTDQFPSICLAMAVKQEMGRHKVRGDCLGKENVQMTSFQDRLLSFSEDRCKMWQGPKKEGMAWAGWFYLSVKSARCPFCHVTTRRWEKGDDPWLRHEESSPFCRYLRRAALSTTQSVAERKQWRHSTSFLDELTSPP